jgi:copper transport protein
MTASSGQLEVRASTPPNNPGASPPQIAEASVTSPTGTRAVPLRGCGDGCFVGPVSWVNGRNELQLDVTAQGWSGAQARFDVPWPPVPAPEELRAALAAMAAVPEFELTEAVTSDTSVTTTHVQTIALTGPRFLATEPYNGTAADSAMLLSNDGEITTIALAVPADGYYIRLELTPDGRFLHEVLTTPNHLIDRTFQYP